MPPVAELDARVAKARKLMRDQGMDGLVVTDALNFGYYTGQTIPAWMSARPAVFILPQSGDPVVIDWSGPSMFARLYHKPSANVVKDRRIYPEIPRQTTTPVDWGIADILREKGLASGRVGIEIGYETRLNLAIEDFELLRQQTPGIRWVDSGPVTWGCRMIKSDWEIEQLKKACAIGAKAWGKLLGELKHGMTSADIQRRIVHYYLESGADMDSGPPTALGGTGPGGAFQQGDILYLDGGCRVSGYRMDFTRRAVFGQPSARQRAEHDGMWEILFKVMAFMKDGVATKDVFAYSQKLIGATAWTNYSSHPSLRIGHGIGLGNEPPYLNAYDKNILREGMSLTPEPKIEVKEGLLNPEEHVIVRSNGVETISNDLPWALFVVS